MKVRVPRIDVDIAAKLLVEYGGNISAAAQALGVRRQSLHDKIGKHKKLQDAVMEGRLAKVGKALDVLQHHLDRNSLQAAMFVLKTLGKEYGFTERVEVNCDHPIAHIDW